MKYFISILMLGLFLSGCNNTTPKPNVIEKTTNENNSTQCKIDNKIAPEWICGKNTKYLDYVTSIGIAAVPDKNNKALIIGIEKLFEKIKEDSLIRSKEYFIMLGISPEDYKGIPSSLSYYLSKAILSKTYVLDEWVRNKTKTKYLLVGVKKELIRNEAYSFLVKGNESEKTIKAFSFAFDTYFTKKPEPSF